MDKENVNPIVEVGSKRDASIFGAVPSTDVAAAASSASEAAAAGGSQIPAGWDPYEPVPYVPPPNPYDTSLEDPWNEIWGSAVRLIYASNIGSQSVNLCKCLAATSAATKRRRTSRLARCHGGRRSAAYSLLRQGGLQCPFCTRRLGATDFNCLVTHAENISTTFPKVGTTVNVHSFRAKHMGRMHLRSQRVEISAAHASAQAQGSQGEQEQQVEAELDGVGGVLDVCCAAS
ncbi:hypothetical protein QYE76_008084 [Lolium multiflorum]|uniref:Uncharacterized protein n=1 Tax=Lolium multiflorum TaxID=4521 RepID=A0AAD8UWC5_LOLMU|nr:hypothetical protein QYE76_008084 [Lolium multiflorum]